MRRGVSIVGVGALLGVSWLQPSAADGTMVICQRGQKMTLREDTCRGKEHRREASELGLVGPEGPAGAEGPQGTQGAEGPAGPSTGPAGGALAGTYPDPTLAPDAISSTAPFAAGAIPAARVVQTSQVAFSSGSSISWQQEQFDTAGLFTSASPTVMTIPIDGLYAISSSMFVVLMSSGSYVEMRIVAAGAVQAANVALERSGSGSTAVSASTMLRLNAGETVSVAIVTNSTGTPNLSANPGFLAVHWVGPIP